MIYKVAWKTWRYESSKKLLGISIFSATLHCFCKWNWKAKAQRGLSALLWWVKSALMKFKRGRSHRQKLWPILFFWSESGPWTKSFQPPPPIKDPLVWPLTDMHGQAFRAQRKGGQNNKGQRVLLGDDWQNQENLPLKNYWVFSPLQCHFQLMFSCCFALISLPSPLSLFPFIFFYALTLPSTFVLPI